MTGKLSDRAAEIWGELEAAFAGFETQDTLALVDQFVRSVGSAALHAREKDDGTFEYSAEFKSEQFGWGNFHAMSPWEPTLRDAVIFALKGAVGMGLTRVERTAEEGDETT